MSARFAPLATAAVLLASCSFTPEATSPVAAVPAAYDGAGGAGGGASELGWAAFFGDARLATLIGRALARNQDLAASVARVEAARAQLRIVRADRLPTLDAGAGIGRARQQGFEASSFSVDVGVSAFELDFWGRVRALSAAALARYLQSEEGRRAFELSLIAEVARAYLAERALSERIALAERAVESRRESLRIAKLRLDAGVTSALDFTQADVLLRQAETLAADLKRQRATVANALLTLTGGPDAGDAPLPAPLPLFAAGVVAPVAAGLPSDLLADRPDVRAAEQALAAANADIGAARAAFFPRISLTGLLGLASPALGSLFGSDGFAYSAGAGAGIPIFDGGRLRGNRDAARARYDEAVALYRRQVQRAFEEVANALAARRYLADQLASSQAALAAERQRARLAELRYANGVAGYLEVLDAERGLFDAEQALVATRGAQLDQEVALYTALGGGAVR